MVLSDGKSYPYPTQNPKPGDPPPPPPPVDSLPMITEDDKVLLQGYILSAMDSSGFETSPPFVAFSKKVTEQSIKHDKYYDVMISATKGANGIVKYQSLWDRENNVIPTQAKSLTTCTEKFPIGVFFLWIERDGKPTSSKDWITRIFSGAPIQINEN